MCIGVLCSCMSGKVCCLVRGEFGEVGPDGTHGVVWDSACV